MKRPRKHQKEAISAAIEELATASRATITQPCGTGKTLTGAWIAEALNSKITVIFLPSLWLMRQTIGEWQTLPYWKNKPVLGVCSEDALFDDLPIDEAEGVTTNPDVINKTIQANRSDLLIACTYHSSKLLSQSLPKGICIDVAVYDEAHCTAGLTDGDFAYSLDDKNVSITKRIFFTATPKMYDVRRRELRGLVELFSMDNERVYGKTVYNLSYKDAVKSNLICDYKVIVPVITTGMIDRSILENNLIDQREGVKVAMAMALDSACKNYGINSGILFFNTIDSAENFSKEYGPKHINSHNHCSISSRQKREDRAKSLHQLKSRPNTFISNARVLTMGVDVPAVDLVAFMEPKRGEIDIVQAVGRASRKDRKNPNKTAYVVVPIFLEDGESIESASQASNLDSLWATLESLRETDETLESWVELARGEMGLYKDIRVENQKLEVIAPNDLDAQEIKNSIDALTVELLSESWDYQFEQLKRYRAENGDCNVPKDYQELSLGQWVRYQRKHWETRLTTEKQQKLLSIGFEVNPLSANFDKKLSQLRQQFKTTGSGLIPSKGHPLSGWAGHLRKEFKSGNLNQERINLLNESGFIWVLERAFVDKFEQLFPKLECYYTERGAYPARNEDPILWRFVRGIREHYKAGTLDQDLIDRLSRINFDFDPIGSGNQEKIRLISDYYRENKTFKAPSNSDVSKHIRYFRKRYSLGKLDKDIELTLRAIGLPLENQTKSAWNERYEQLKQFQIKSGHSNPASNHALYSWCKEQRKRNRAGNLSKDEMKQLNDIGFVFS